MNIRAHVVFDLDGTLVDSAHVVRELLNGLREERGLPPITQQELLPLLSLGGVPMLQGAVVKDFEEAAKALEIFRARYAKLPTPIGSVYPGVVETLQALRGANVPMSICTNKPRNLANKVLNETGLSKYFRHVCAGDDLPSRKPDRANLQACLTYSSIEALPVYLVGDSKIDEALAFNGGVPFWFFSSGYDDGVNVADAAAVFSNYKEFPIKKILGTEFIEEV
jgi:phosphoglycolate phosphatase